MRGGADHVFRFVASFVAFSDLTNDEHTRTFLCMEVGAGHQEVIYLSYVRRPQEPKLTRPRSYAHFRMR